MEKIILLALVTSVALLAGCKEEAKTYAWYKDHPDETYNVYKKCLETGEASLNCEGARRAAIAFARGGDKDLEQKFNSLK
ncbi:TPA: EexN family lipoprotein [Yersinia enterocolitica]|uniref:EexN family lipoprotein n=1 Tax=Yersinia massiliensis TaxID=419257 RepID=UPI0015626514|nr:EexN family lipoprotein [Yersinia massiliensis]QKJ09278.1 EexN family lipoprotein [Yersinia massiliensis]HDX9051768.1 EexN family lipoprotein [Yersinia enterocolitica]